MDSITHIALGACIGEVLLAPKLGKKALLWGAIAQSLPDIDFVGAFILSPDATLLAHRGITHSILFAIISSFVLAYLIKKIHRGSHVPLAYFLFFFILQMLIHDLLDICNAYGTGIFEPFSHHRYSIHLLYVADPLFSIAMVIAALMLSFSNISNPARYKWAIRGIFFSVLYLFIAGFNKWMVNKKVQETLGYNHIRPAGYILTPTPFNSILWYIVAAQDSCFYTGYQSVFDSHGLHVPLTRFEKNKYLLRQLRDNQVLENLMAYSEDYYTVEQRQSALLFNVLRFGQVQGWSDPHAPFVFHYFLNADSSNMLVVQRSRFEGWSSANIKRMVRRMAGLVIADNTRSKNKIVN